MYQMLSSGAWNADGRLLVSLQDAFHFSPGVLDTKTGSIQALPSDLADDYVSLAWLPGNRMAVLRQEMRSTLWRFAPVNPPAH